MATQPVQPAEPKRQRGLKFCPNTSDLLYPRENKGKRVLEYYCKNCDYVEEAAKQDWCVYVSESVYGSKDKMAVLPDVRQDPTLPRTRDVRCPQCDHTEAVFIHLNTEQGMTLYYCCDACGHRWRDYV